MLYCTDASFLGMTGKTINTYRQVVDICYSTASQLSSRRRRDLCILREQRLPLVVLIERLLFIFAFCCAEEEVLSHGAREKRR
jgi:hypothetical protein